MDMWTITYYCEACVKLHDVVLLASSADEAAKSFLKNWDEVRWLLNDQSDPPVFFGISKGVHGGD